MEEIEQLKARIAELEAREAYMTSCCIRAVMAPPEQGIELIRCALKLVVQPRFAIAELLKDQTRLNRLEHCTVTVRRPLRYGSRELFYVTPDEEEGGPTNIRELIDQIDTPQPKGKSE